MTTIGTGPLALRKPQTAAGAEAPVVAQFLAGYAALWVILTLMTESSATRGLAAALAVSIATGATVLYLAKAIENLGLASSAGGGTP